MCAMSRLKSENVGESSRNTWGEGLPPSPWAPLKRTTSLTNLMASPMSPFSCPSPTSTAAAEQEAFGNALQSPAEAEPSSIWRSLLCWQQKETYGKKAWKELLKLNSRLSALEQQNLETRKTNNTLISEMRRFQELLEAKENEDRALKEEMRRIISICRAPPTQAALVYHGESPTSSKSSIKANEEELQGRNEDHFLEQHDSN